MILLTNNKRYFYAIFCLFLFFIVQLHADEILSWKDCIIEAQKANPNLIYADEAIKVQHAVKDVTVSECYPQVSSSIDASRSKTSSTSSSYSYGASASQLIFNGTTNSNIKASEENIRASEEGYHFISSEVRKNLRFAFVSLMKAQELIKVSEDIVEIRAMNNELIALRYQSGLEHKGSLLTAEAEKAKAEYDLAQAKRSLVLAQKQLIKELGRTEFKRISAAADYSISDVYKDRLDFDDIINKNPEVLQAEAEKNSAKYRISSAYGNFVPEITATAGIDRSSSQWPPRDGQWNAGLRMSIPIFEGNSNIAGLSQAKARYRQSEEHEKSIRNTCMVALEESWSTLQNSIEYIEVQRKILQAREERAVISEAQYSAGFIAFDNWIIIQNDLVAAKKSYLDAQADTLYSEASWVMATGETLEYVR